MATIWAASINEAETIGVNSSAVLESDAIKSLKAFASEVVARL